MGESKTQTTFVIKNNQGQFLEFQGYSGLRMWVADYSEKCAFTSQNAATLYCRSLIADAKLHGLDMEFDVFKYNNQIVELDVSIPDNQLVAYGLPAKEENTETKPSDGK